MREALNKASLEVAATDIKDQLINYYTSDALDSLMRHLEEKQDAYLSTQPQDDHHVYTLHVAYELLKNIASEDQAVTKQDGSIKVYDSFYNVTNKMATRLFALTSGDELPNDFDYAESLDLINTYVSWLIGAAILTHYASFSFDIAEIARTQLNQKAALWMTQSQLISRLILRYIPVAALNDATEASRLNPEDLRRAVLSIFADLYPIEEE